MNYVKAQWAVFCRTVTEKNFDRGPWWDSGIRALTRVDAMERWMAKPRSETDWVETDLRLVEMDR